ncbi:hypothetical protein Gotur_005196 [Gossypium turneri]
MGETVIVINSFLMTTPICLTLDDFSEFLKLPPDGESNEKGLSNPILVVPSSNASKLNLHDHFQHLILTWILRSISKHAITRSIDYWWIEIFQTNRHPDLALIMFNDIPKAITKGAQPKIHEDEDEDVGGTPDSIPSQEKVPPHSSTPPQEQKFSTNTLVILVAILCLNSLHLHHLKRARTHLAYHAFS